MLELLAGSLKILLISFFYYAGLCISVFSRLGVPLSLPGSRQKSLKFIRGRFIKRVVDFFAPVPQRLVYSTKLCIDRIG